MTLWTVRAACVCYALALAAWILRRPSAFRLLWTAGFACYAGHVLAAFTFHYSWSHQTALAETARQTADLFRVRWGGGLYFNYAFTAIWAADVVWLWMNPTSYRRRSTWLAGSVHAFMGFMFFNGAVVFATGWMRWFSLTATALLAILWIVGRWRPGLTSASETRQTISL